MDNKSVSDKTQNLIDVYRKINDEGRDVLDMAIQKLGEFNDGLEKIKDIEALAFLTTLKGN